MLELNASRNVAEITMNGETHELYYRTPTPEELVGFQAEGLVRKGKKIVNRMVAARIKYGQRVLIGFKTGTIGCDGKAISSDPKDNKIYRADWKTLLLGAAPQLVAAVGQVAFEGVRVGGQEDDLEFVSEVEGDLADGASSLNIVIIGAPGAPGAGDGADDAPLGKG
jgi:hypothetical protein